MKRTVFTLLFIGYHVVSICQNVFPTSGNVGIGTTTPSAHLEIADAGDDFNALRVGITTNRAHAITQLLESAATVARTNADKSTIGTVAWDYYNNGSNPSWAGTLMEYSGSEITGNAYGVPASNQGRLIFQNTTHGLITSNGCNILIAPNSTVSTSFLSNGNVGIGTTNPGNFKLAVEGKIGAREVQVTATNPWPDYVFEKTYKLISIDSLNNYLKTFGHLPNIPSAQEVKAKGGIELGDMNIRLLEKIEELTLYMIDLKKENEEIRKQLEQLSHK